VAFGPQRQRDYCSRNEAVVCCRISPSTPVIG
jgi:hypothetical protein